MVNPAFESPVIQLQDVMVGNHRIDLNRLDQHDSCLEWYIAVYPGLGDNAIGGSLSF